MASFVTTSLDAIDTSNGDNEIYEKDIRLGQKQSIEGIPTNRNTNGYRSTNKNYQHSYPVIDLDLERWNWNCCARMNLIVEKDGYGNDRGDDGVRVVGSDYGPAFSDDDGGDGDDSGDGYGDHRGIQQTFDVWEKEEEDDTENHSECMMP